MSWELSRGIPVPYAVRAAVMIRDALVNTHKYTQTHRQVDRQLMTGIISAHLQTIFSDDNPGPL